MYKRQSEENRPAALETAKELVEKSLKDNGCIAYDIFESATSSDVLMICEDVYKRQSRYCSVLIISIFNQFNVSSSYKLSLPLSP